MYTLTGNYKADQVTFRRCWNDWDNNNDAVTTTLSLWRHDSGEIRK